MCEYTDKFWESVWLQDDEKVKKVSCIILKEILRGVEMIHTTSSLRTVYHEPQYEIIDVQSYYWGRCYISINVSRFLSSRWLGPMWCVPFASFKVRRLNKTLKQG